MSNELVANVSNETIAALDKAAADGALAQREVSQFKRTMMTANVITTLRNLLTPKIMQPIMALQNTSLGFKTDNYNGYPIDVVKDALIEATFKGVYPVGNEFNIIAGRCYITKEGYFHKLSDIPEFSWIEVPSIPRNIGDAGAVVEVTLEWTLKGKKFERKLNFAIRVNKGMGSDAIVGKAIRKARAWLYTTVTGQEVGDGDVEGDAEIIDIKAEPVKESPFEQKAEDAEEITDELPM